MVRINTRTISIHSIEYKIDLIYKLKKDKENGWKFPLDSSLKIVELLNYFYKVDFLLSEFLSLIFDFDDFYKCISSPFSDFYESDFGTVNNSDVRIIKDTLNRILNGLQKIDLEEKKMENLFNLVFIINKCECEYDTNGNIFVKKLKTCIDNIYSDIASDFQEIMGFIVEKEKDKAIVKIMYHNDDIVLLYKICNTLNKNPNSIILDRIKLEEILKRISDNGIFNKLITILERLCELKLQIWKI